MSLELNRELIVAYPTDGFHDEFKYPKSFVELIGKRPCNYFYPWLFLNPSWQRTQNLRNYIPEISKKSVIPFASLELGDGDLACFDATDLSGDPKILMIILDGSTRK